MKKTPIEKFLEAAESYAGKTKHRVQIKIRGQRWQRPRIPAHDIDINGPGTTAAVPNVIGPRSRIPK
jgi:hypothetical protein